MRLVKRMPLQRVHGLLEHRPAVRRLGNLKGVAGLADRGPNGPSFGTFGRRPTRGSFARIEQTPSRGARAPRVRLLALPWGGQETVDWRRRRVATAWAIVTHDYPEPFLQTEPFCQRGVGLSSNPVATNRQFLFDRFPPMPNERRALEWKSTYRVAGGLHGQQARRCGCRQELHTRR